MSLFSLLNRKKMKYFESVPGPKPVWPFGTLLSFGREMLGGKKAWEICADYRDQYGPLTLLWMGSSPILVPNSPELVGEPLATKPENFYKVIPVAALLPVVSKNNPFVANGAQWRKNRDHDPMSQPWFNDWLQSRIPVITNYVLSRCDHLTRQNNVDLYKTIERLTFDIFTVALFGKPLSEKHYRSFKRVARTGSFRISTTMATLPPPLTPFFYLARAEWRKSFAELVTEARDAAHPEGQDLISVSLRHGIDLTENQLALAMGNIYFGGAFSGAASIAMNLHLLSKNDSARQAVVDELEGQVNNDLNQKGLDQFQKLERALFESMRIYPVVPFYTRTSRKGVEVPYGDITLPGDTRIWLCNYALARCPEHWGSDAHNYNPNRWTDQMVADNPLGSGYFYPFGRGPRACMGRFFAFTLIKATLAALWSRLDTQTTGTFKQGFYFGVMTPKGLKTSFTKR